VSTDSTAAGTATGTAGTAPGTAGAATRTAGTAPGTAGAATRTAGTAPGPASASVQAGVGARATLRFFAAARAVVGRDELLVELGPDERPTLAAHLWHVRPAEGRSAEEFRDVLLRCSFLVDGLTTRDREELVPDGAVVDVMPPFAGG